MSQADVYTNTLTESRKCTSKSSLLGRLRTRPSTSLLPWNFILEGENGRLREKKDFPAPTEPTPVAPRDLIGVPVDEGGEID